MPKSSQPEAVVVGAGVVGVSAAYMLARAGYGVTLVDRRAGAGLGTSFGNAAQLSYAYGDAMASPAFVRHLPAILRGRDPAHQVRWPLDPGFLLWGLRFVANGTYRRWWRNTADLIALAERTRAALKTLLLEVDLQFDYRVAGKLHIYPSEAGLDSARRTVAAKQALGVEQRIVDATEARRIEPALEHFRGEICGGIYTPHDAVGDSAAFCRGLTAHIVERCGVKTRFAADVTELVARDGRIRALRFVDKEELPADIVVVAGGAEAVALVPEARNLWPVRGYSLTVPSPAVAPSVSLTDVKRKLAFVRIGTRFRVAGLADIAPRQAGYEDARFAALREAAASVFPTIFDSAEPVLRWSGVRPVTPSSQPIIARSRSIRGVYLDVGHGSLGWTLSLGSAQSVLDLISADR